jgi:uncharacterized membrane protein
VDSYSVVKTIHIVSATVLFGTGMGIAFFHFIGQRSPDHAVKLFAARTTVLADFFFTLPAVILQPATGAWLVWKAGFGWFDYWLVYTYGLYILAGLCWVPVVFIQIRIKYMLEQRAVGEAFDQLAYERLCRWWFALGWPAFGGLIIVFFLMVTKPSW